MSYDVYWRWDDVACLLGQREKCPNTEFFWSVSSCIQSEFRKIQTRQNFVFGQFPHIETFRQFSALMSIRSKLKYVIIKTYWHLFEILRILFSSASIKNIYQSFLLDLVTMTFIGGFLKHLKQWQVFSVLYTFFTSHVKSRLNKVLVHIKIVTLI